MELTEREKDLIEALTGTSKSALSIVPGLGQAIAGWDSYNRSKFDRNIKNMLKQLQERLENLEGFFETEWLQTDEGRQFSWKVVDSALDAQLEDKQQLFINAFVNGVNSSDISQVAKLKFLDMLRHLSLSALIVLAEMDKMFHDQVRRPNKDTDPVSGYPLVDAESIAEKLIDKFDPYLVIAAVQELVSEGLFSKTGEWHQTNSGNYFKGGGFATELCYTNFSATFADFVRDPRDNDT